MNAGPISRWPEDAGADAGPPGPYDPDPLRAAAPWFLPEPAPREPSPEVRAEAGIVPAWARAEAGQAARLARVAARFGALDDRLSRGPEGWRHRLALLQASDLSWAAGARIGVERLALWLALRSGAAAEDAVALERAAWAARRLTGGPGPETGLPAFLGRIGGAAEGAAEGGALAERAAAVAEVLGAAADLHPITRGALLHAVWPLAGIGLPGDPLEGTVVALRLAAAEAQGGAVFAPVAVPVLRGGGTEEARLARWLDGLEQGLLSAQRRLDALAAWEARAGAATADLSGRTPARLIAALAAWPMLSAPVAERITGASRAAVQRNLALLQARGLVREVTGQGRFRFWTTA